MSFIFGINCHLFSSFFITAKWMGTQTAVVFGGIMTLVVVGITWFMAPKLRKFKLEDEKESL